MSEINVDWNEIIRLLAAGNPFIWLLVIMACVCGGILAWIKYEEPLCRLTSVVMHHFSSTYRVKKAKKLEDIELCNHRYEKFADKIYGLICRISDLRIDPEQGRNHFYQFLVKSMFESFFKGFTTMYADYTEGKIKEEDFTSYRKSYHKIASAAIEDTKKHIHARLSAEGWSEDKITYINDIFKVWMSAHVGLLRELMGSDEMAIEVVKTWWVFFYEMFMDIEKFGLMINGRITGQYFDNYIIKEAKHE